MYNDMQQQQRELGAGYNIISAAVYFDLATSSSRAGGPSGQRCGAARLQQLVRELRARRARAPPPRRSERALLSAGGARRLRQSTGNLRGTRTLSRALDHSTYTYEKFIVMPMAAIQTYQNLGVNQKPMQLQNLTPRRLAPAPMDVRCKKKSYLHQPYPAQPASVARRNARERNRVKQVNNGFAALRQHIPSAVSAAITGGRGSSRKLSKVDTLKLAVEYIKSLKRLLDETDEGCSDSQMSLAIHSEGPQTPPSSESSQSPAPSLLSDTSAGPHCHDIYDTYDPMSPEDEELLDVIAWWQQK